MSRRTWVGETLPERFMSRVSVDANGCWIWTGKVNKHGYGRFSFGKPQYQAHRVSFEAIKGAIPEGLDLDHLCRVRACVNPDHLEPVTRSVNLRRSPLVGKHLTRRTECAQGHPYSAENTRIAADGTRRCRTCEAAGRDRRRERYTPSSLDSRWTIRTQGACKRGHPWEGDNVYVDPRGGRHCRACNLARRPEELRLRRERRAAS